MTPTDYRPQWYEDAQPEAAHAASEIDDDHRPADIGEVCVRIGIWSFSAAVSIAFIAWALS